MDEGKGEGEGEGERSVRSIGEGVTVVCQVYSSSFESEERRGSESEGTGEERR